MRDWVERMSGAGATVLNSEGLMCHEGGRSALSGCEALGQS
ncbi:MAG: hypothetical protein ACLTHS_08660 [Eubacterium sp.]